MTDPTSQAERGESPSERADRNYVELMQELRVAQTGVQILFAFLLSLAFLERFPVDRPLFTAVLTGALVAAAASALSFMAPVAAHRLRFRRGLKEGMVWVAHWMAVAGMTLLLVAMDLALWLVLALLWSEQVGTVTALALPVVALLLWVVIPAVLLGRRDGVDQDAPAGGLS